MTMIAVITKCPSSAMTACWASYNLDTNRSLLSSCHVTTDWQHLVITPTQPQTLCNNLPEYLYFPLSYLRQLRPLFNCPAHAISCYWNWLVCSRVAPQLSADSSSQSRWRTLSLSWRPRAAGSNQSLSRYCCAQAEITFLPL